MLFDFGGSCLQLCLWTVFLPMAIEAEERQVKAGGKQGAKMFKDVQRVTVVQHAQLNYQLGQLQRSGGDCQVRLFWRCGEGRSSFGHRTWWPWVRLCCVMLLAGRCKTQWEINERGSIEPIEPRCGTFR